MFGGTDGLKIFQYPILYYKICIQITEVSVRFQIKTSDFGETLNPNSELDMHLAVSIKICHIEGFPEIVLVLP